MITLGTVKFAQKLKHLQIELNNVTTADGSRKLIFSINGQLPGPPIIVYESQERGTPWMDGVAGVSQCPINPEETFTYRFLAKPAGTNWYHSHIGAQRTEGLAGPLIILENKEREDDGRLPVIADDYIMMLQDWMHQSSDQMYYQHLWNMAR
ncbi:hypothetical protein KUTeg_024608 [Tegillarca granosa]|uniref:Plastocyanin-like domain-containing protein n=1 Tax=Tegillarca granosa TaxID=220873 RepID=A0ABQ9E3B1_TEGGR|nr:hypothetical protein KUTeg_024608 [Tegillarca granosa]